MFKLLLLLLLLLLTSTLGTLCVCVSVYAPGLISPLVKSYPLTRQQYFLYLRL